MLGGLNHNVDLTRMDEQQRHIWNAAIEASAKIVDECNREGPYNAIGAASRIRKLAK